MSRERAGTEAFTTENGLLSWTTAAVNERGQALVVPDESFVPPRPVTAIMLGAGARGTVYGNYALAFPRHLRIVGVADPHPLRRAHFADAHGIAEADRHATWDDALARAPWADAVIVATPDHEHFGPAMVALRQGYHLLLEKPIAPTEAECRDLLALADRTGTIVAVCHVLRYAPYFQEMRALIRHGAIGELASVQHMEPIGHAHMAHSYVRGQWRSSRRSTPILLAKSSHDLDILRWLVGRPTRRVQAFGSLQWFTRARAPDGSTERCTDGCAVEATCPYSALRIYDRERQRLYVFDLPDDEPARSLALVEQLHTTDYGRCVYRLDNDQPDHYVATFEFDGGVTASFTMDGFTPFTGRRTRVMGSMGYLEGDMQTLAAHDFRTGETTVWRSPIREDPNDPLSGHGGGDWRLVADWVKAVATGDAFALSSTLAQSIESHLMAFAAERSRHRGSVEPVV